LAPKSQEEEDRASVDSIEIEIIPTMIMAIRGRVCEWKRFAERESRVFREITHREREK